MSAIECVSVKGNHRILKACIRLNALKRLIIVTANKKENISISICKVPQYHIL